MLRVIWILVLFIVCQGSVEAQTVDERMRIALVVNHTAKTLYDLEKRLNLILHLSGKGALQQEKNALLALVRDQLVDEIIKRDEAVQNGLELNQSILENSFNQLVNGLGIAREELDSWLSSRGLLIDDLREMLENQALWALYQNQFLEKNVVVSESEVEQERNRRKNIGARILLRQITINYNQDNQQKKIERIEAIRERLIEGSSFSVLAKNFSEDSYAIDGGIVGWVIEKNLSDNLRSEVEELATEQISKIIREDDKLLIVRVEDRQKNHELSGEEIRQQLFLEKLGVWVRKRIMVLRENAYIDIRY